MSLLQRQALFFCNLEVLAQSDPFEGTLPPSHYGFRNSYPMAEAPEQLKDLMRAMLSIHGEHNLEPEEAQKQFNDFHEYWARYVFAIRRLYFVNCWHINEFESSAMWDIYSRREEGIAIVSSEERLLAAFSRTDFDIVGGKVRYEDYAAFEFNSLDIDDISIIELLLKKRVSFEHEKEYRLVWHDTGRHWKTASLPGYLQVGSLRLRAPKHFIIRRGPEELEALPIVHGQNISCGLKELVDKSVRLATCSSMVL